MKLFSEVAETENLNSRINSARWFSESNKLAKLWERKTENVQVTAIRNEMGEVIIGQIHFKSIVRKY